MGGLEGRDFLLLLLYLGLRFLNRFAVIAWYEENSPNHSPANTTT